MIYYLMYRLLYTHAKFFSELQFIGVMIYPEAKTMMYSLGQPYLQIPWNSSPCLWLMTQGRKKWIPWGPQHTVVNNSFPHGLLVSEADAIL